MHIFLCTLIPYTGYNKIKEVLDALYPGCVYRFVKKLLDNIEIKQAAIADYETNTGIKRHTIV